MGQAHVEDRYYSPIPNVILAFDNKANALTRKAEGNLFDFVQNSAVDARYAIVAKLSKSTRHVAIAQRVANTRQALINLGIDASRVTLAAGEKYDDDLPAPYVRVFLLASDVGPNSQTGLALANDDRQSVVGHRPAAGVPAYWREVTAQSPYPGTPPPVPTRIGIPASSQAQASSPYARRTDAALTAAAAHRKAPVSAGAGTVETFFGATEKKTTLVPSRPVGAPSSPIAGEKSPVAVSEGSTDSTLDARFMLSPATQAIALPVRIGTVTLSTAQLTPPAPATRAVFAHAGPSHQQKKDSDTAKPVTAAATAIHTSLDQRVAMPEDPSSDAIGQLIASLDMAAQPAQASAESTKPAAPTPTKEAVVSTPASVINPKVSASTPTPAQKVTATQVAAASAPVAAVVAPKVSSPALGTVPTQTAKTVPPAPPTWNLDADKTLRENLEDWSTRAGYRLKWSASNYVQVVTPRTYHAQFLDVVKTVSHAASSLVRVEIYPDSTPPEIRVSDASNSHSPK